MAQTVQASNRFACEIYGIYLTLDFLHNGDEKYGTTEAQRLTTLQRLQAEIKSLFTIAIPGLRFPPNFHVPEVFNQSLQAPAAADPVREDIRYTGKVWVPSITAPEIPE